jgi:hypothetical protein
MQMSFADAPLPPLTTAYFVVQYSADIARVAAPNGGNNTAMWLGSFVPVVDAPRRAPDVASFNVAITTPHDYTVVGAGIRLETIYDEASQTTRFQARQARGFAFAVSQYFSHAYAITDSGVAIHLYYLTATLGESDVLARAHETVRLFESSVGAYPPGHITLIEADAGADGAAFSQFIFVSGVRILLEDYAPLVRDIGRQWFGIIVDTSEPWLADSLAAHVGYSPAFDEVLNRFYQEYSFGYATVHDLMHILEEMQTELPYSWKGR